SVIKVFLSKVDRVAPLVHRDLPVIIDHKHAIVISTDRLPVITRYSRRIVQSKRGRMDHSSRLCCRGRDVTIEIQINLNRVICRQKWRNITQIRSSRPKALQLRAVSGQVQPLSTASCLHRNDCSRKSARLQAQACHPTTSESNRATCCHQL
ncbi:MAG: hypothetical protein ACI90E_001615, partial [Yoonia sp.]